MKRTVFCLLLLNTFLRAVAQTYVAPTGGVDAAGRGTATAPYATIDYGINNLRAGSVVLVLQAGVHRPAAPLTINRTITLQGQGHAVVDGQNLPFAPAGSYLHLLKIMDANNVTVESITFRNCFDAGAKGIWVTGIANNATIQHCTIENIAWDRRNDLAVLPPIPGTNQYAVSASAIKVDGVDILPVRNFRLLDDTIRNCAVGYGEGVTINGNVDGFRIERNVVSNVSNIGIVAAGNNLMNPVAALDRARNGVIAFNRVSHCMSGRSPSAGIYLDGSYNCTVVGNVCTENGVGISVGNEGDVSGGRQPNRLSKVWSNQVSGNVFYGLSLGTGASNLPVVPRTVRQLDVRNNTVWGNQSGLSINNITQIVPLVGMTYPLPSLANQDGGEVFLLELDSVQFRNNIVVPRDARPALNGSGYGIRHFQANYNGYYSGANAPLFQIGNLPFNTQTTPLPSLASVADFYARTRLDSASVALAGNPGLVNPGLGAGHDFALTATSRLLNQGDPRTLPATGNFALDCAGQPRIVGGRIEVGAYENQTALAVAAGAASAALRLFPNPASGLVQVVGGQAVAVRDALGAVVRRFEPAVAAFAVSGLPAGLYLVELRSANGPERTQKLVVY